MSIKVFIADDHPIVLEGIQKILSECDGIDLGRLFYNGYELLEGLKTEQPDVLLLDIQMPGKQGNEIAQKIREDYPEIAILVLTNLDQSFHVQNMFKNGARGYLLKSSSKDKIRDAIVTVFNGAQYLDPVMREQMVQDILDPKEKNAGVPILTEREKEILHLIVHELTSPEIAEKMFLSQRTIEHYRDNLLLKLGVKNTAGLVRRAIQLGLAE